MQLFLSYPLPCSVCVITQFCGGFFTYLMQKLQMNFYLLDSFNTFLSIIYCDGRHGPCWDITGQKRMTNVYSGMILKSWESHLDGDGLKSGQEMMRLFFSFQIWIVYEMLLHQTFLLFNLAELSSFPWLFFSKGWGLIASLEHIRPQPLQTWCLIWSKIILIINLDITTVTVHRI